MQAASPDDRLRTVGEVQSQDESSSLIDQVGGANSLWIFTRTGNMEDNTLTLTSTTSWPPEMVAKFGSNVKQVISDLRRAESIEGARHRMQGYGLSEDEMRLALEKVPIGTPQYGTTRRPRTRFNAAMWLLGASWRQLAKAQKVSHQSVWDGAKRILGDLQPRSIDSVPQEMIQIIWQEYYRHWQEWGNLTIEQLADKLEIFLHRSEV